MTGDEADPSTSAGAIRFRARVVGSRWDVAEFGRPSTSAVAAADIDRFVERMPSTTALRSTAACEATRRERGYNSVRPHQALGYLTPAGYLASLEAEA